MTGFQLQDGEKLLINDPHAMWMKSPMMAVNGQLKLTDRRFVFVKDANPLAGILKLFMKSQRAHVLHEFAYSEITGIERHVFGKSTRLEISNSKGRPLTFTVSKIDTIEAELKRLTGK